MAALESLLERLEATQSRAAALIELQSIHRWYADASDRAAAPHFSFSRLEIPSGNGEIALDLLQLPSVFAPEEWSFTFYEGLIRIPVTEFERMVVAESGCGNGWVSMALAQRTRPAKVYGLDINPRAILCARLNLFLNAYDDQGELRLDGEGKSLLDRCEFHVSDLLGHCIDHDIRLDRVVGCIPQVLSPDIQESLQALGDQASDEALLSLSNYCGRQGYVEDQFGLGLMARVLEESIEILRPQGRVVFNMGGRPGEAVLRRLFERRGFAVQKVWQTRVQQAGDTEIEALVEIENGSSHRFEFFSDLHSETPIDARCALAYARAGGDIFHAITVFGAQLRHPIDLRRIFSTLRKEPFRRVAGALDLSYEDAAKSEEKCSFLASLGETLEEDICFPYEDTAGSDELRRQLSDYFAHYFRAELAPTCFTTFPSRGYALLNLSTIYEPKRILCDQALLNGLPEDFVQRLATMGIELLEIPRGSDLVCALMEKLEPDMVITALASREVSSANAFRRLLESSERLNSRLIVDISESFELSSSPALDGVLKSLATGPLPSHVGITCALNRGQVYPALELSFLITENAALAQALIYAAELTYSRTPRLTQAYYERILADLSSFRLARLQAPGHRRLPQGELVSKDLPPACRRAFDHPALDSHRLTLGEATIRLDYGENALPSPARLRERILEAFARRHLSDEEADARPEVARFLERRLGLVLASPDEVVLGSGVAPLFAAMMRAARTEGARLLLPRGSYGYFAAVADFMGLPVDFVDTDVQHAFKLQTASLRKAVDGEAGDAKRWLYLNAPVVNPSGAVYGSGELSDLLKMAASLRITVVLDTIFSGLEFEPPALPVDLASTLKANPDLALIVLGGVSKEFAAGGLRFGYSWASSAVHCQALRAEAAYAPPHNTLTFAMHQFLGDVNRGDVNESALKATEKQREILASRAKRLVEKLRDRGWSPLPPEGGLFVMAHPSQLLGQTRSGLGPGGDETWVLNEDNIATALFYRTGLLVNGGRWTGLPGHCRFVLSVDEEEFERALTALDRF